LHLQSDSTGGYVFIVFVFFAQHFALQNVEQNMRHCILASLFFASGRQKQ